MSAILNKIDNYSHRTQGILVVLAWLVSAGLYAFLVLSNFAQSEYIQLKEQDSVIKAYFFEALPLIFLIATLYYWDRKTYFDARLSALAPLLVPMTAWGFRGLTDGFAWLVYQVLV